MHADTVRAMQCVQEILMLDMRIFHHVRTMLMTGRGEDAELQKVVMILFDRLTEGATLLVISMIIQAPKLVESQTIHLVSEVHYDTVTSRFNGSGAKTQVLMLSVLQRIRKHAERVQRRQKYRTTRP